MARKPCKTCGGKKAVSGKPISRILKLGASTIKSVNETDKKSVEITGNNNTSLPRLLPPPIFLEIKKLNRHKIKQLKFPSNGTYRTWFVKYKKDKNKEDK